MTLALRIGLGLLALLELILGLWTSLFPRSFYDLVPTVNLSPPFSEHLFRDLGGASLGIAVVLIAAVIWPETRLVIIALLACTAFTLPHFVFHVGHLEGSTPIEAAFLTAALATWAALPIALLLIVRVRSSATARNRD